MKLLSRVIFFKLLNWKLIGTIDPSVEKCVVIVAPHTSWYDFFLGLLVRRILDLQINFIGKKELFKPPFGWYFRWVGGVPLDRTPNQNKVEAITGIFRKRKIFRLALSPEGTRKKTERWKTGFYYIARSAEVPIIKVAFDYGQKEVRIAPPVYTTKNTEEDLNKIYSFYDGVTGKKPENF
ncbi:MAG TPA: 1-acyl-sn-glycerol-3-phosphate acyltransferase [Gillisia sp.]|nr:1-acyl-sn-glycerol-3-phosphate acyltransferase [Gillisia sp.]